MKIFAVLLSVLCLCSAALAQESAEQPPNHSIDHLVLAINDLERGMEELQRRTGVRPRADGSDAQLGTHSAVIALGPDTYLEIMAPDPDADTDAVDPELRVLVLERIREFEQLTPFLWVIATENMPLSRTLARRVSIHTQDPGTGARKKGWRRGYEWSWTWVYRPESRVTPWFIHWPEDAKRPQDRAPGSCSLDELRVYTKNFRSLQGLIVATQVAAQLEGADEDALQFTLDCDGETVVFEPVELTETVAPPGS